MESCIERINLYYKGIYLQNYILHSPITLERLKKETRLLTECDYSIPNIYDISVINCNFHSFFALEEPLCGIFFKTNINEESQRIIEHLDILESIGDNCFVDKEVNISSRKYYISYAGIIAERNYAVAKSLFIHLRESNQLICSFLLRDLIENIKLYLFFLRGAKIETIIKRPSETFVIEKECESILEQIRVSLEKGDKDWGFDVKKIIKNNPSLAKWEEELIEVGKINQRCNRIIHKNGLNKILPRLINNEDIMIDLKQVFFCIKLFFTLVISYDGKVLAASDYWDALENGETPSEELQFLLAPIYQDFLNNEFSCEEKKRIKDMTYMLIE